MDIKVGKYGQRALLKSRVFRSKILIDARALGPVICVVS